MQRNLLTWSDRTLTPRGEPSVRHGSADRGPLRRLLAHADTEYRHIRVLTSQQGEAAALALVEEVREQGGQADLLVLPLRDPTDHGEIFGALQDVTRGMPHAPLDVCLSAGTPQMQTLWVILVAAGLLPARMVQVIPAAFVPSVHPHPVRVVELDIDGFPEIRALREEVVRLRAAGRRPIVGDSPAMHAFGRRLSRVARSEVPVLIIGETGTGKELAARAVHEGSPRADGPFVAENCGAFTPSVLASELFGHERGAFTGAQERRRGLFEQAHGGTLFLDEVGEMSPRVQVMLLRALQEGTIRRVGGEQPITVDVRVIGATHRNLDQMVARNELREDLYYRLSGATLHLPPLRERHGDLERLVSHFLGEIDGPRPWPTAQAWSYLQRYPWPGNIRQLRAEVVRWTVFCEDAIDVDDLSPEIRASIDRADGRAPGGAPTAVAPTRSPDMPTLAEAVGALERSMIESALEREGTLAGAARSLAIDRNTLKRKLRRFGLRAGSRGPGRPRSDGS